MKRTLVMAVLCTACGFFFAGCETSEDNSIAKAQACLDVADRSNASQCRSQVEGLESPNSYLIRCSSDFIAQGFDSATMSAAFSQLSDTSGNKTTDMMGFLVFSTGGVADQTAASQAMSDCRKSLVPAMTLLASFAQTATLIASMCSTSCTFDPATGRSGGFPTSGFTDGLNQLYTSNDPTKNAIVGNAVLAAYNAQCSNAANSSSDICAEVVAAIGGTTDPATIGRNLITRLHNNP